MAMLNNQMVLLYQDFRFSNSSCLKCIEGKFCRGVCVELLPAIITLDMGIVFKIYFSSDLICFGVNLSLYILHLSHVIYHISYIIYHISYITYHISYIIYHIMMYHIPILSLKMHLHLIDTQWHLDYCMILFTSTLFLSGAASKIYSCWSKKDIGFSNIFPL